MSYVIVCCIFMPIAFCFELIGCFSFRVRVEFIQIQISLKFESNQENRKPISTSKPFRAESVVAHLSFLFSFPRVT
jgi:hypothetical protein